MLISLKNTGKRYNRDWIFRHLDYEFSPGKRYAITGNNGSGKSTLLQVVAGAVMHTEGKISYSVQQKEIEEPYKFLSVATPYLELIEEMTALEFLSFHNSFKPLTSSKEEILTVIGLGSAMNKQIRYFSSGMKQRLKLGQAIFSNNEVLLLDEPLTNLDAEGISLYNNLMADHCNNKTIIISSNDPAEYEFCEEVIRITDYKVD